MFKYLCLFMFSALTLLTTGCESLDLTWNDIWGIEDDADRTDGDFGAYKPKYVLSFNEVVEYPRAEKIERKVRTFDGESVWVNIIPKLHSKNITQIKIIQDKQNPSEFQLKLKLNHTGRLSWMYVTGKYRGEKIAIMLDGVVYTTFVPRYIANEDDTWITIPAIFDEVIAKRIEKYAEKNYDHFNPSIHRIF
jgi:hypothetical protein